MNGQDRDGGMRLAQSIGTGSRLARHWRGRIVAALAIAVPVGLLAGTAPAAAQRIENGTAVFAALDKVTARISKLEVKLGETKRFGALKVTPRACYSRSPTEPPRTATFVEVDEIQLDGTVNRIFTGWMFAESPGLNAVEHAVFDVWLTDCSEPLAPVGVAKGPRAARPRGPATELPADARDPDIPAEPVRRRPRR